MKRTKRQPPPLFRDRVKGLARLPADRIETAAKNFRTHDDRQRGALDGLLAEIGIAGAAVAWVPDAKARASLRKVDGPDAFAAWLAGFTGSVRLIDGHLRRERLAAQGQPVLVTDLDEREASKALATFDAVSDLAGVDAALLASLLEDVGAPEEAGTADLLAELRKHLPATAAGDDDDDDDEPVIPTDALVKKWGTAPGQLWVVPSLTVPGRDHRILCGDCREPRDVARLLGDALANIAFTSPPYASQRKYDQASGFRPIPPDEYVDWFEPVQANVRGVLAPDGSWFVNIKASADGLDTDLYVLDLVIRHARSWGWHFATELCWYRSGMPKSVTRRFKNEFEPIYQFTRGAWKMRPDTVMHPSESIPVPRGKGAGNTGWGGGGRITQGDRDVFAENARAPGMAYPGNVISVGKNQEANGHEAAFPPALPAFFLRAYTDPGDVGFDPFVGSGTTIVAAEQTGRIGYGTEISARYVAVILERLAARGLTPRLAT